MFMSMNIHLLLKKFERMLKETAEVWFKVLSRHSFGGPVKSRENPQPGLSDFRPRLEHRPPVYEAGCQLVDGDIQHIKA